MALTVVITGSTRGIGRCMAVEFLRRDCLVVVSGRPENPPTDLASTLAPFADRWTYVPCDVRDVEALERLWTAATAFGGGVDVWINNAGRNAPHGSLVDLPPDCIDALLATNLGGVVHGSRIAARGMLRQGRGAIWNMEGLGSNDMIQVKTILYGTSKRALTYFTRGLARELADTPVRAGRLSPGMMLTDFITKTAEGEPAAVLQDKRFRFVFNALGDRPETVAAYLVPRMLRNRRNDAQIAWLTGPKAFSRFLLAPFRHRQLIP
jgi:NAD(P)-dependent dehydrogenase (short-subunit alcohol dehydrogenase family)